MSEPLHERLWRRNAELAGRCLAHPFVRGLGDGSLPVEAFRRYVAQDAFFLRSFLRAFALCAARTSDLEAAGVLADMQRGALEELNLHAPYARSLGIDLERVEPLPAASAYCDFLLRCAWQEEPGVALAAMTPCLRLYHHLGSELARAGIPTHRYAEWIRAYSSPEFGARTARLEALLDRLAADTPAVADAYRRAMRCEIDFFSAPLEEPVGDAAKPQTAPAAAAPALPSEAPGEPAGAAGAPGGRPPVALTIAGSDPSGGAGLQADLKTFHQHGVYGASVVTLLTVQNTRGVEAVRVLEPDFVLAQLDAVLADLEPGAAKTGALGSAGVVRAVARRAADFRFPLVVDPVLISKHGAPLLDAAGRRALVEDLLPRAALVTPNLPEAAALAGFEIRGEEAVEEAARRIAQLGARAVLIKGGHRPAAGDGSAGPRRAGAAGGGEATDVLYSEGRLERFAAERIDTDQTHGTGCTYAAAIAAQLARGRELREAVAAAKRYITRAIRTHPGLGRGYGPVNHHAEID
jgi:hydroxymethylpyrimidine/phosphomethylpyrimidine kinase